MDFNKLTNVQKDILREVGNIGAGNAATSMSKLIDKKVFIQVPSVKVVDFNELMDLIGGPDNVIVGMFFRIDGEIPGSVYFLLSMESAEFLIREITNNPSFVLKEADATNQLAFSALSEVGNIVMSAYLSAMSDFTKIHMQPTVPHLGIDMAAAIVTTGLIEISQQADYTIMIDTKIEREYSSDIITGNFLFMPDPAHFSKIFRALGMDHVD